MLSEYRKTYEQFASQLHDWKKLSKSELCFKYLEYKKNNNSLSEVYLAAIIAKFLKKAELDYYNQTYKIISEEQYYDLIIESITRMLDKKCWENKESNLYGNKDAPEIAINTNIKSNKINLYIYLQRDKRRLNSNALSLESLEESSSDGYFIPYNDKDISVELYANNLIRNFFNKKEYLNAFIINGILYEDTFTYKKSIPEFNSNKLKNYLKELNEEYCLDFSKHYNISFQEVENSLKYIKGLSNSRINTAIQKLFKTLKNNKDLYMLVHNAY